ncbi:MAG: hypothetical protein AAGD11_06275 [Planctomycetota bacterium]
MSQTENSFVGQFSQTTEDEELDIYEPGEDYRAYGISRKSFGGEPALCFIFKSGKQQAKPWSQLDDILYEPGKSLTITFINQVAILKGRNLETLYGQLVRQRVLFIVESDRAAEMKVEDDDAIVTEIEMSDRVSG